MERNLGGDQTRVAMMSGGKEKERERWREIERD